VATTGGASPIAALPRRWSRCRSSRSRPTPIAPFAPEPSKPGIPAEEDPSFEKLPIALEESLEALEQEPATKDFFGEEFVTAYSAMRRYELSRFADSVTDWERAEYLELF